MPRKQRFKPSRKPKVETPQAEPPIAPSDGGGAGSEPHREGDRTATESVGESD